MTDTGEQDLLGATAREFFADFVDNTYLNEQEASQDGYEIARWKQMCELGWTAVNLPARVGGADGNLAEAAVIARECGRAAFASPLLQTMRGATALTALNRGDRANAALSALAGGAPAALVAPPDRGVHANPAGDGGYLLSGRPVVVEWVSQSESLVVLVPLTGAGRWLSAVLPRERVRDRITPVVSVDNEHSAWLDVDGLPVPSELVVADDIDPADAEHALARANLLRAGAMVGGCESVLDFSARYAKERTQFGQPIGAFQAVRHHLARMVIATDAARLACDEALRVADQGVRDTTMAALALFVAGRSYVEVVLTAAQVHGGVGTTTEHVLHHHFRRAKAMRLRSGKPANRLRELAADLTRPDEARLW